MATTQNKTIKLYGPWRGTVDQDTKTALSDFEVAYNVEIDGDEVRTRLGRAQFSSAPPHELFGICELRDRILGSSIGSGLYLLSGANQWSVLVNPTVTTTGKVEQFVPWEDSVILLDGANANRVYDGVSVVTLAAVPGRDSSSTSYMTSLPPCKFGAVYHGKLYLATLGGTVIFSENSNNLNAIPTDGSAPQYGANLWVANNNFDVRASPSDRMMGMVVYGDQLVILTSEALWVWDDYALRKVQGAPGCVAPRSAVETPKGLVYLSADGLRLFSGSSAPRVSEPEEVTLTDLLTRTALYGAVAVHHQDVREYRLFAPAAGATRNNVCIAWNYHDNRWFMRGGAPPWTTLDSDPYQAMEVASAAVVTLGTSRRYLITSDYTGALWLEDIGVSDNGKPIYSCVAFKRLKLGEDDGLTTWRDMRIQAKDTGAPIKAYLLEDGKTYREFAACATEVGAAHADTVVTLSANQPTWASNGSSISRTVPIWRSWKFPMAKRTRTAQPVLICDGYDADGDTVGGRMTFRGIEVQARRRPGRRA